MKYSFGAISAVTEIMPRLQVYQVTLSYSNFDNKSLILSKFLLLKCSYMSAKLRLVKNIVINFFVILLACINLDHTYSKLFFDRRQLADLNNQYICHVYHNISISYWFSNLSSFTLTKFHQFESTSSLLNSIF